MLSELRLESKSCCGGKLGIVHKLLRGRKRGIDTSDVQVTVIVAACTLQPELARLKGTFATVAMRGISPL